MRIDRFFISNPIGDQGKMSVTDEHIIHQWRKVLRLSPGAEMDVCDNSGFVYRARLKDYTNGATIEIIGKERGFVPDKDLTLYCALIKKDKFELVAEKATELGVTRIVPVATDFSLTYNVRFDRLEKIVREASEQSERAVLPDVTEVMSLEDALENAPEYSVVLVARSEDDQEALHLGAAEQEGIFVGPEGGWSEKEMQLFDEQGVRKMSLGKTILRAETAAIVGVAQLLS